MSTATLKWFDTFNLDVPVLHLYAHCTYITGANTICKGVKGNIVALKIAFSKTSMHHLLFVYATWRHMYVHVGPNKTLPDKIHPFKSGDDSGKI